MRSNNVLLVIVLFAVSFSNAFEFTNLAEVKALRANSYGNSLIETISLTLQNSGSIGDVEKLLNDLLFDLNKDQEASDAKWNEENKTLTEKIDEIGGKIVSTQHDIALNEALKKENEDKIVKGNANLEQYNNQFIANGVALQKNEENRQKDEADYKASVTEHNDVINAIEAVIAELSKLEGSVSGQGKPEHVEEIEAETRDREYAASQATSFAQLTREQTEAMIFAQLATTADQEALHKLIGLLEQLSEKTKESLNEDAQHEEDSIESYNTLKGQLENDNKSLTDAINEQTANLKKYNDEVTRLTALLEQLNNILNSLISERDATIKERQDKENKYNQDKAERNNERTVIQRLQKIVQERLANMSKFLKDNTGGF